MVTWRTQKVMSYTENAAVTYGTGDCLSMDIKPTDGIYNGSSLYEIDTKKTYKFNEETGEWLKAAADGSNIADIEDVREVLNNGD